MTRVFGPGCYYGGLPKPQLLWGNQLPWAYQGNYIELEGAVPVYKLHGSLNWSRSVDGLKLFQTSVSHFGAVETQRLSRRFLGRKYPRGYSRSGVAPKRRLLM